MPASTSVKRIESTMRGAPTLNGTAGTLIAVLDTLFVSGWGATTALSVNVAGGIATAQLTPGETFDKDAVVLVAGATPSALNGEARVKTSSNASITWETTAPDGAATGTITIKYAPQTNWQKVFAAPNKAVYKSNHVQSNGHHLRIDDTGTTSARVRGFESMTDVDTGTGPFPTDAQMASGGYWWKNTFTPASAVKYRIFCDERFVLVCIAAGSNLGAVYKGAPARGFGDPIALAMSGDAWSTILSCAWNGASNEYNGSLDSGSAPSLTQGAVFCPRAIAGLGGSVMHDTVSLTGTAVTMSGNDNLLGVAPSVVDGQIKTSPRFVKSSGAGNPPRSKIPGILYVPQSGLTSIVVDGDTLAGSGDLAGRRLVVIEATASSNTAPSGVYLVDTTGPWR